MVIPTNTFLHNYGVRQFVRIDDSFSMSSQLARQRGYVTRCKYEFDYCRLKGGVCYFLTFTFNDKSVLNFAGLNWSNNLAFRKLMINRVYSQLKRKYNCTLRYFCAGELGDGKGQRGFANNPHMHVLFFIYPNSSILPTEQQFFDIVRTFWRGSSKSPKDAPFGIVSYSSKGARIDNDKACYYVAKYCTKDKLYRSRFCALYKYLYEYFASRIEFYEDSTYITNHEDVLKLFSPFYSTYKFKSIDYNTLHDFFNALVEHINAHSVNLSNVFGYFIRLVSMRISNYILPKVLCSNGLGLYGLEFVDDWTNPKLPFVTKSNNVVVTRHFPIPLYYYRKKFCDVDKVWRNGKYQTRYVKNEFFKSVYFNFDVFKSRLFRSVDNLWNSIQAGRFQSVSYISNKLGSIGVTTPFLSNPLCCSNHLIKDLHITRNDVICYVIYMSVYFGRNVEIHFKDLELLPAIAFDDFRFFLHQEEHAVLMDVPFIDSQTRYSDFYPYMEKFDFIVAFELFLKYFNDEKLVKKNDEWRETHRQISFVNNSVEL